MFIPVVESLTGLALAFLADAIWRAKFWGKDRGKLRVLEHYHWGLVLCTLGFALKKLIIVSAGFGLIIAEELQQHPFAMGSDHFKWSTILGFVLLVVTVLAYLLQPF